MNAESLGQPSSEPRHGSQRRMFPQIILVFFVDTLMGTSGVRNGLIVQRTRICFDDKPSRPNPPVESELNLCGPCSRV